MIENMDFDVEVHAFKLSLHESRDWNRRLIINWKSQVLLTPENPTWKFHPFPDICQKWLTNDRFCMHHLLRCYSFHTINLIMVQGNTERFRILGLVSKFIIIILLMWEHLAKGEVLNKMQEKRIVWLNEVSGFDVDIGTLCMYSFLPKRVWWRLYRFWRESLNNICRFLSNTWNSFEKGTDYIIHVNDNVWPLNELF